MCDHVALTCCIFAVGSAIEAQRGHVYAYRHISIRNAMRAMYSRTANQLIY